MDQFPHRGDTQKTVEDSSFLREHKKPVFKESSVSDVPEIYPEPRATSPESPLPAFAQDSDILRITPFNLAGRQAFHTLVEEKLKGQLSEHHAQYLSTTGTAPAWNKKRASDPEPPAWHEGHFRIGFDCETIVNILLWSLGRGSSRFHDGSRRNIDVLIAPPKSDAAYGLRSGHLGLEIHSVSGAWVVRANGNITIGEEKLSSGGRRAFSRHRTYLDVNEMHFWIEFMIKTPEQEEAYVKLRDQKIEQLGLHTITTPISGIPFQNDNWYEEVVFRHGAGAGTHASVFEGFEPASGDLRIVKIFEIKDPDRRKDATDEITALERFQECEGVVRIHAVRNSRQGHGIAGGEKKGIPPVFVYLVQERGEPFNTITDWNDAGCSGWDVRLSLCYQLLKGLEAIHAAGCMHRDITPMNLLYFHRSKRATLCDFGKFIAALEDDDSCLAGWAFLPHEILKTGSRRGSKYTQSIDIYMLGHALVRAWYPEAVEYKKPGDVWPRQREHHSYILGYLSKDTESPLSQLFAHMIHWDPAKRPPATKALTYPCFKALKEAKANAVAEGKRARVDE